MAEEISFGQIVRERRNTLGLTQAELARRVGCAPITVRKIEGDALRPSVQLAELLAHALNVPAEEHLAFVRLARQAPPPSPIPTPSPTPDEIGQPDLSGRSIKGFELRERIGSGGFGVVYRAVQPSVNRDVAVKIILPHFANHPTFIRHFETEAQLVTRLEHPHIVPLYDYWREPDAAYLILRLLHKGSLEDLLQDGPLTLADVQRITMQIGLALHAAHGQGVVHRDIKPANVLLDEDHNAYLADFGIAKPLELIQEQDPDEEAAFFGSPAYVSPEQIRSEPVRPSSDIYCFGLLLYEMLSGHHPFPGPTPAAFLHQHLSKPVPLLETTLDLPPALDSVIQRATAKQPQARYPDMAAMLAELEQTLNTTASGPQSIIVSEAAAPPLSTKEIAAFENPYRGLRAFAEADAASFFGRETLVQELLVMLSDGSDLARFIAVVGPSGSGKSSVVKAGLIPALRRGGLPGSEDWYVVDFTPGSDPWVEMKTALLRVANDTGVLQELLNSERGLLHVVNRILPADPITELLLIIDQFEELFTLVEDEAVRLQFLESVVTAVLDPLSRVRVLITLRADFTDRPLQFVNFGELMQQRMAFVLPLTPNELTQAISKPVLNLGMQMEPELIATIVQEVGDQPGMLPLLQYAMTELFEQRDGQMLTQAGYYATGGVSGALARRADELYDALNSAGQDVTRQMFLRLVTLGEGIEDTRRRVHRAELEAVDSGMMHIVIDAYGRFRLLTFDHDPLTRQPAVEVAHEALLREWPRLRHWLAQSRDDIRLQRLLSVGAAEWTAAGHDVGFLLRGSRLDLFANWASTMDLALTQEELTFLEASLVARQEREMEEEVRRRLELETAQKLAMTEQQRAEEQALAAGRLRRRALLLTGALVVATVLALAAVFFANQSSQNAQAAVTEANQRATAQIFAEEQKRIAVAEADTRATAQSQAESSKVEAVAQQATAVAEASFRATAEADAIAEQNSAEEQTRLTTSRELALAALVNLDTDPERSVLLALEALKVTYTNEAEEVLHRAVRTSRVINSFSPHKGQTRQLAYSPDGQRLATVGTDGLARLWDPETGQELIAYTGHAEDWVFDSDNQWINYLAFSPNGARLATIGENGMMRIWNTETGEDLLVIESDFGGDNPEAGGYSGGLAFSPDGTKITRGSTNGARIWDSTTGEKILTVIGHNIHPSFDELLGARSVDLSTDDRLVTAGHDDDALAIIWDVETGEELITLTGHTPHITDVRFSPDGLRVATTSDADTRVWDSMTGELIYSWNHPGRGVRFSADGSLLGLASDDGTAKILDMTAGQELITLAGHLGGVQSIDFSPDGTYVATAATDGSVKTWHIGLEYEALTFDVGHTILKKAIYSPNGEQIATLGGGDGTAHIRNAQSGEKLLTLVGHAEFVSDIVYSTNGALLATASDDGTARVWDTATGETIQVFAGHKTWVNKLALNPDSTLLATAGNDQKVIIWDIFSGKPISTLESFNDGIWSIAFSPDGSRLATGTGNIEPIVQIWDVATGEQLLAMKGHEWWINDLAFNPDGSRLLSTSGDATARLWEVDTGEELLILSAPTSINSGAISPDGHYLATGELTGNVRLWDAVTGTEFITLLEDGGGSITNVEFNPEGDRLLANVFSAHNGIVHEFILPLEELIELARSRVTRSLTGEECRQYLHLAECPK